MAAFPKIPASAKASRYPPPTEGSHVCVCSTVVDLGRAGGPLRPRSRRCISPSKSPTRFNSGSARTDRTREPKRVSTTCTVTLSEKANLRGYVEGVIRPAADGGGAARSATSSGCCSARRAWCTWCTTRRRQHLREYRRAFRRCRSLCRRRSRKPNGSATPRTTTTRQTWEKLPKFLQEKIAQARRGREARRTRRSRTSASRLRRRHSVLRRGARFRRIRHSAAAGRCG